MERQRIAVCFALKSTLNHKPNGKISSDWQRSYRNTTEKGKSNKQELPLHMPSFSINSNEASFVSQHTEISKIHEFESFNIKKDNVTQRTKRLEYTSIWTRFWLTIISLAVLLIAIYLLLLVFKISIIITTTTVTIIPSTTTNGNITASTTTLITTTTTTTATPTKEPYYCSGVSPYTLWQPYLTYGMSMDINTTQCNFNSTPLYFVSLGGISAHFGIGGYTAIYSPTRNSFTIYAAPIFVSYTYTIMLNYSQTFQWNINWLGILE